MAQALDQLSAVSFLPCAKCGFSPSPVLASEHIAESSPDSFGS
jgi:hypothetical protein